MAVPVQQKSDLQGLGMQANVIFHAAAQSKGLDAELTMQQFLRTFAMLAARMMPDAASYMAGELSLD